MAIINRQLLGQAERHAARNDRHFVKRISTFNHCSNHRVAGFVICGNALFMLTDDQRLSRDAHQDLIFGIFEIFVRDRLLVHTGRIQSSFVDQIRKICARKSRRASCDDGYIDILSQLHLAGMHPQDLLAPLHVGQIHRDLPIETARTQQRRIENVRPVRGCDQNDAFVRFETVHLDEQLVQGLLALIVSAAEACATMAADRVDFIDEDDARSVLLSLFEQVADA